MIRLCAFADEAAKDFDGQVRALKENNISLLEMRKIDGANAAFISIDKAKEYKEKLASHGISVWSLGSPVCKVRQGFDRAEYAKKVEHACRVAAALGADKMRVFSFYPKFFRFDKEKVVEDLRYFNSIAESHGIRFCCENDTKQFLAKADYFHLKDAVGKKVVPAGFGEGHIADIVNSLDRDAVFTIEPHLTFFRGSKQYHAVFGNQFDLKSARGRFDCAVAAAKKVLTDCGYTENGTCFTEGEK